MSQPVIDLSGIWRTFPTEPPVHALRGVNLRVDPGEYLSIVGPSGSGKSTMLNVLGMLDRPTKGVYRLDGYDTSTLTEAERSGLRGTRIGFVFQSFHLMSHRTVTENVMAAMLYNGVPRSERRPRAEAALAQVGLAHRMSQLPTKLSGGERQRVAIARAIVSEPAVLLADEPTGNLDTSTTAAILDALNQLRDTGITLVMITHDVTVAKYAERIVRMIDGELSEVDHDQLTTAAPAGGSYGDQSDE